MTEEKIEFDEARLSEMNDRAIKSQLFTPDYMYVELGLMKDIPIGCMYTEKLLIQGKSEAEFSQFQSDLETILKPYQTRLYDTIDPFSSVTGYRDADIAEIIGREVYHDHIFLLAPMTSFFNLMIRHMIRNQNHSKPGNKVVKKKIDKSHYVLEPVPITYRINTYPLKLSAGTLQQASKVLGESFGANIVFMSKDPASFDQADWDEWLEKVDCFYFDSIGAISRSPFFIAKQGDFQFNGTWMFTRKRFEKEAEARMKGYDFETEIAEVTTYISAFCEFEWIQNNDIRLTQDKEDVPMTDSQVSPDTSSEEQSDTP